MNAPLLATVPYEGQLTPAPLASVLTPDQPDTSRLVAADSMSDAHDVHSRVAQLEAEIAALKEERRARVTRVDRFTNRRHGGHGTMVMDDRNSGGELVEYKTLTCAHCNCVKGLNHEGKIVHARIFRDAQTLEVAAVHMLPTGDPGYCGKCHAYLCDDPICNKMCTPISRALEYNLPIANRPGRELYAYEKGVF